MATVKKKSKKRRTKKKAKVKARAAPSEEGPYTVTGPRIEDGILHFSALDLSRYDLLQHKTANALQGAQLKELQLAELRRQSIEQITRLEVELTELNRLAADEKKALMTFQEMLEIAYELDFSAITYDDATGRIFADGEAVCRS